MTLGNTRLLLTAPLLALLAGPLSACEELEDKGSTSDSGLGDDDDDDDTVVGDDDDDDDSGLADLAEGTYNGIAGGIVNDIDYDLTVIAETALSVTVSGPGIDAFTIPLVEDGGIIQQGQWNEGSFQLDGDLLQVSHTMQGFNFEGTRL